jgi:disulfide bond formation protein DsbB
MPPSHVPFRAVALILVASLATIGGAYLFEYAWGYVPCALCLIQRKPYYAAIVLALVLLAPAIPDRWRRVGLGLLALIFVVSAGLGAYHAGVEWGWWLGPSDCGGGGGGAPAEIRDFLKALDRTRVVSCTEAAWRFLGLSLAGWNVVVSLALAAIAAACGLGQGRSFQGSSSVSQYR